MPESKSRKSLALAVGTLALGTMAVGLGVDLVLPSIPTLPAVLGGTTATGQFVLAGYVGGAAVGLVLCGWLADHVARRTVFIASLAAFAVLSFAGALAPGIGTLIAIRVLQGAASSGPGVVMAGMVRSLFDDTRAIRAMGFLGSVQSLVPALAPVAGAWLTFAFGWAASFVVTGVIAGATFLALAVRPGLLPAGRSGSAAARGTYRDLFRNRGFLVNALGYALSLGGLVVFVFAAPVVIVDSMNGSIADFVVLQVVGIATFIVTANSAGYFAGRMGSSATIATGTGCMVASASALALYALLGGTSPAWLIPLWIPMNIGIGLRGPASYVAAVAAARSNDARASALLGLFLTGTMAGGTALVAPFLHHGLIAAAVATLAIIAPAGLLLLVKRNPEGFLKVDP